jgi:hypothetical protein
MTALAVSYRLDLVTVPTLLRVENGVEVDRREGWLREQWEELTGIAGLGADLPEYRVLRMLAGTTRAAEELVAVVPPDLVPATVEKVAVNAVLAGRKPEYLPVVLAAVEAACTDAFDMHGLLATTYFSGPVVVVNGPIPPGDPDERRHQRARAGQPGQRDHRSGAAAGDAQRRRRSTGRDGPGGVGQPGKLPFCFAGDEEGSPWEPLSVSRGAPPGRSAVTLFAGDGVRGIADQISRTPESLARSFALVLRTVGHPKLPLGFDACLLVVRPEHARTFRAAGWSRDRLLTELTDLLRLLGEEIVRGAGGIAEGAPEKTVAATGRPTHAEVPAGRTADRACR